MSEFPTLRIGLIQTCNTAQNIHKVIQKLRMGTLPFQYSSSDQHALFLVLLQLPPSRLFPENNIMFSKMLRF